MVEVQFMTLDEITEFRERAARGAGYVYYRDETDYKFGSDEPIIPKHTRIDLTPAIIRMAQNTFINYGSLNYSTNDINDGKKIILQQDMTEIERFDRIYRQENWASEILNIALAKAQAGEMSPEGDIALQQLAFTEGRSLLDTHGREIEKRINFKIIHDNLQHHYLNRYMADFKEDSKSEIWDMQKADAYRALKSNFKPLLMWKPYGRANYRTYLTRAVLYAIRSQIELDAKLDSPSATARRKWGYKGIAYSDIKGRDYKGVLMSLDGSLDWRYRDTWQKAEALKEYIVEKKLNDINPEVVSNILGGYVNQKDLKRILRAWSVWIYPPGAKYLFQLPPPKMGKHGIPKEEIKMQIEDRDEGPATRTKYLIPYEKANDFIYKYCT